MSTRASALLLICSALTGPLLAADGALDPSFNGSGKLSTVFNPGSPINADLAFKTLVQADQKIVVVGWILDITDPADMGAVRYNPNGTIDQTFGNHGFARVGFGFLSLDEAFAAARQADGKILIGGFTSASLGGSAAFALARLRTDGTPDPAFGSGGMVQTDLGGDDWILALKVQSDGKILAAGWTGSLGSHDFALVHYNTNNTLDTKFGTGGKIVTDFSGHDDRPGAIAVQSDGKILIAGLSATTSAPTSPSQIALVRYTPAGKLDTTFGTGGKLLLTLGIRSGATAVAVLAGGKILVGGGIFQANGHGNDFLLVRLNPTGTLDKTFGTAGKVVTDFGGAVSNTDDIASIAVLTNGKILAAGEVKATTTGSGDGQFGLARYTASGQLDTTFGTAGKITTQLGSKGSRCTSMAVQANGRIVAVGHVFSLDPAVAASFGVARYLAALPAVQSPGDEPLEEP